MSHIEGLINVARRIFQANSVATEVIRPVDSEIAAGLGLNMADTHERSSKTMRTE
jgi:hypothetical protein